MEIIKPAVIRQLSVLFLILLTGGLIFWQMLPYLTGILGAITLYVLLRKWMEKLEKRKWPPSIAAAVLLVISAIVILMPVGGTILLLGNKIGKAVENSEEVVRAVKNQLLILEDRFGYDFTSEIDVSAISTWLSENLQNLVGGTFNTFIALGIMYFLLYFMLTKRTAFKKFLYSTTPMKDDNIKYLGEESITIVYSNALGIPLVALAQGIVALIGFLLFRIPDPFFWFVIVTIGSMVPFIGAFLGILPVFIMAISSGNSFQAWGILLYGLLVVGLTDNLIRLYILKKLDDVHPLITLIGVIIGVPLFGFIGLIFGPLLLSLFFVLVRIYRKEFVLPLTEK